MAAFVAGFGSRRSLNSKGTFHLEAARSGRPRPAVPCQAVRRTRLVVTCSDSPDPGSPQEAEQAPAGAESGESTAAAAESTACEACGRAEGPVRGCDGSGRIAGGFGAVLDWWPIKAYRPCPELAKAKKEYRKSGQSLDEIAFGRK